MIISLLGIKGVEAQKLYAFFLSYFGTHLPVKGVTLCMETECEAGKRFDSDINKNF